MLVCFCVDLWITGHLSRASPCLHPMTAVIGSIWPPWPLAEGGAGIKNGRMEFGMYEKHTNRDGVVRSRMTSVTLGLVERHGDLHHHGQVQRRLSHLFLRAGFWPVLEQPSDDLPEECHRNKHSSYFLSRRAGPIALTRTGTIPLINEWVFLLAFSQKCPSVSVVLMDTIWQKLIWTGTGKQYTSSIVCSVCWSHHSKSSVCIYGLCGCKYSSCTFRDEKSFYSINRTSILVHRVHRRSMWLLVSNTFES